MDFVGVSGLNHVTLAVSDLDRALGFYCDILGLRLRARWDEGAYLEAGALWLCLARDAKARVGPHPDYSHLAFDVTDAAFDALQARILNAAPIWKDNRSEGRSLYFLDPDGRRLEIHVGALERRLDHYRRTRPAGMTIFD